MESVNEGAEGGEVARLRRVQIKARISEGGRG